VSRDVSFVIPCLNEGENVRRTVESLESCRLGDYEIIVVDNGSIDDSTRFLVEDPDTRRRLIRFQSRLGVAGARNLGAAFAEGELLVFCDSHIVICQPTLEPLLELLRVRDVGVVGPAVSAWGNGEALGFGMFWTDSALNAEWLDRRSNEPYPVPLLAGLFQAFRTQTFFRLGGYDPGMTGYGHEDVEICLRAWLHELPVLVVPDVEVSHLFRPSAPYDIRWEDAIYNALRLAYSHFGLGRLERVLAELRPLPGFDEALSKLNISDVWLRRRMFEWRRRQTDDWFFDWSGMTV
jgi:glycosyltransferase involved in cell wall biosynthesis